MKRHWKRLLLTAAAMGMFGSVTAFAANVSMDLYYNGKNHAYNAKEITIKIDGDTMVPKDMPAVSIDGRTMLPMRQIAQELGCEVVWNESAKQVYMVNDEYTLVFEIDKTTGYKNGKTFTMDVPPMIVNDRTMLPVRALATALGLDITWEDASRTVQIRTEAEEQPSATPSVTQSITLNQVKVPTGESAGQVFTIRANGKITDYEELLLDDSKIVLDFYGAKSGLPSKITATNSAIVSAVRTAQHTTDDGAVYTRVVFDLNGKKGYDVSLSSDKTQLIVTFDKVTVEEISAKHKNEADVIEIEGNGTLGANVFTLSNPNRIVVDIPNVESKLASTLDVSKLKYVSVGRMSMFTETTLRLVFEVGDLTEYSYTESGNGGKLEIHRSTLTNMVYDAKESVLYLEKETAFKTGSVKLDDHYLDGYFDVILPENLEDVYGYGTYDIGDDVIEKIEVSSKGSQTTLRFYQNRISCYSITERKDRYVISIKNPQQVYKKVVLLDAGHGGSDPGASGNGITEKNMNLTIMQKVAKELNGSGIKVYVTRDSDVYPSNSSRAEIANEIADAMVSIHMNSGSATANGTEVLYKNHSNDTGNALTSQKLAELIQSSIIEATGNTNRGTKLRTDLLILNSTKVPTVIVETVFISNLGDALKISQTAYQDTIAEAIADAIKDAMDLV